MVAEPSRMQIHSPQTPAKPVPAHRHRHTQQSRLKKEFPQRQLTSRLFGLRPADFHPDGIAIYTTSQLVFPSEFKSVSHSTKEGHTLQDEEVQLFKSVAAVLIFADITNDAQLQSAVHLGSCVSTLGPEHPPSILVPHSTEPTEDLDTDKVFAALSGALSSGINGSIVGEPTGLALAGAVRSEILTSQRAQNVISQSIMDHREKVSYVEDIAEVIHDAIWDHMRIRSGSMIPVIDYDLPPCEPGAAVGKFHVGEKLGAGANATVYTLYGQDSGCPQVVKAVAKTLELETLKSLNKELNVMREISKDEWTHPNIVRLSCVFHSELEVLVQMESGGPRNLHGYLRGLERKRLPLGVSRARSIVTQSLSAICHLQLLPKVAHLDIKPENIALSEESGEVHVKICDFGNGRIVPNDAQISGRRGTFPFMAPEMMRQPTYDPLSADIWSLGMVVLEVLCCSHIVEKTVDSRSVTQAVAAERIYTFFDRPDAIECLLAELRYELQDSVAESTVTESCSTATLLKGMMSVTVAQRWTAKCLSSFRIEW